tara:strand:+ start:31 stop:663 length:633 start_codon:yes stop_codon:yes gene_type:complete
MEKINTNKSRFSLFFIFIKNNLKLLIYCIIAILILIAGFEYYKFDKTKKIKKISINYFKAINKLDLGDQDSIILLNDVAKSKNGYGIMSKIKLIDNLINKKEYYQAYEKYNLLINDVNLEVLYRDLIIVNAGYNLIGHVKNQEILNLIEMADINTTAFKSHIYEIKYINSIGLLNDNELNKLYEFIQNDIEIINEVKRRIKKINEFMIYE